MWTALGILKLVRRSATDAARHPAVAMIGVKPGDKAIVLGAKRPDVAAAVSLVTGLNGQVTVVDRGPDHAVNIRKAAEDAGRLIDFIDAPPTMVPIDSNLFDVAILPAGLAALGTDAPLVLAEAIRLTRPIGRVAVCEPVARAGLFRLAQTAPLTDPAHVVERLTAIGLRAARHIGTIEGTAYIEAAKPR